MTAQQRADLALAQAGLLAALTTGAAIPSGFDPDRIHVQAVALAAKRRAAGSSMPANAAAPARPRWWALRTRGHAPDQ